MRLRILTENDVRSLIDMDAAIPIQEEAFIRLAARESVEGLRSFVVSETPPGVAIFNPSFLKNGGGTASKSSPTSSATPNAASPGCRRS